MNNDKTTTPEKLSDLLDDLDQGFKNIGLTPQQIRLLKLLARHACGQQSFSVSYRDLGEKFFPDSDPDKAQKNIKTVIRRLETWQNQSGILFFHREPGRRIQDSDGFQYIPSEYHLLRLNGLSIALYLDSKEPLSQFLDEVRNLRFHEGESVAVAPKLWMKSEKQLTKLFRTANTNLKKYLELAYEIGLQDPGKSLLKELKKAIRENSKTFAERKERRNLIAELHAERAWLSEGESQEKERGTKLTSINQVLTEEDEEK